MKEVELEHLCFDSNEIESGVEVDDNDAFMCEVMDNNVQSGLYERRQVSHHHMLPITGVQQSIQILESHSLKMWIILEVGAHILSEQCSNQEVENTSVMPCLLAPVLF
jgi:hypothetical protein